MGQSDSFADAVGNVREMNGQFQWSLDTSITKDEVFKEMLKFKWTAAILLKNCIPEYKDLGPLEIARLIRDERDRGEQGDQDIIQDEIDLISGIEGTGVEKNTIKDITFRVLSNENRLFINLITVNFEMQNKFRKKKPNTISRAVYYAASGLRATVAAKDKEYANMHKVYTIWFCAENVVFENGINTAYIGEKYGVGYVYKHRFGMFRFYDAIPCKLENQDKEADLMEVVMIDLKVLRDKVQDRQNGKASDDERVMLGTIYDIPHAIELMEQVYEVDLTSYEEGVNQKLSLIERLEEQQRVNEEQQRVNEEQQRVIKEKERTIDELKKMIAELQNRLQLS